MVASNGCGCAARIGIRGTVRDKDKHWLGPNSASARDNVNLTPIDETSSATEYPMTRGRRFFQFPNFYPRFSFHFDGTAYLSEDSLLTKADVSDISPLRQISECLQTNFGLNIDD